MNREKLEKTVLVLVGIIAAGALIIVGVKHILPVALPFIIAWGAALYVKEPSRRLSEKIHLSERIIRPVMAMLIALLVFGVLSLILWQIIELIWGVLSDIGAGNNPIYHILTALGSGNIFGGSIPEELAEKISDAVGSFLSSALSWAATSVTGWVSAIPNTLLFILITVISTVYFAIDLEKVNGLIRRLLPEKMAQGLSKIKNRLLKVAKRYLCSYLLIFGITFVIMLTGLMILRIKTAFVSALIIAFLDILPVIGVGTVLIPWSIFAFATGDNVIGVGLIVLFLINTVIREVAEPKILGKNLGIHPIVSLILIYAGYALFGFTGLILTPIIAGIIGLLTEKAPDTDNK